MPGQGLKSEREIDVCLRVREFRMAMGQSQQKFANEIGMPLSRFNNLEAARMAVTFGDAARLIKRGINPKWLATEEGPMTPSIEFGRIVTEVVPPKMWFTRVWDLVLAEPVNATLALLWASADPAQLSRRMKAAKLEPLIQPSSMMFMEPQKAFLHNTVDNVALMPPEIRDDYLQVIQEATRAFWNAHKSAIEYFAKNRTEIQASERAEISAYIKQKLGLPL